ncbi:MAG TPA: response regulator transcription factor [Trichocoleus sp.]|jgi:DNA-binding NarL/FixJ family response regulator
MIQVGVVARSTIIRAGLAALLTDLPTLTVTATAAEPETILQQLATEQLDVILLDIESQSDDFTWLTPLLDRAGQVAILLLIEEIDSHTFRELIQAGVRGILPKMIGLTEMAAAIEAIASGLVVWHPDFAETVLSALSSLPAALPTLPIEPILTPRESEVLQMLAAGLGNKTIARRLSISEHTVKFHISSIFSKLQVSSRTEAVMVGTRSGLILL